MGYGSVGSRMKERVEYQKDDTAHFSLLISIISDCVHYRLDYSVK